MGINYYLRHNQCKCCNRYDELHIGKSSAGWCFSLHVIPEKNIHDLEDWEKLFNESGNTIFDENDEKVSVEAMIIIITNREWGYSGTPPPGYKSWECFHNSNHSEDGPNHLIRHKLKPGWCIKHGTGTWDCLVGEFS
jgi:hypothetical protein